MPTIRLKPGHVQPVWAGHPWVFAQAVDRVEGGATAGDEVRITDPRGKFLGRGFYSPTSAIVARVLVRDEKTKIDGRFFHERLKAAAGWRKECHLPGPETTGFRVVHADGDSLPGLIVDRFGDVLAVQFLTFGMKVRESLILQALIDVLRPEVILDRTPTQTAKREGFDAGTGAVIGDAPSHLDFLERRIRYHVPVDLGQKTGFYFDQRALRGRVETLAAGKRVLDAYSYIGPFAIAAARGGAKEVVAVDESALALETAAECAGLNGVKDKITFLRDDARRAMQSGEFDMVLLDPPRLAPTRSAKDAALTQYSKLAELGCRATKPGGLLVMSSCSAAIDIGTLTRAVALGGARVNRHATIVERAFQGVDHPVLAAHPEGLYLKSVIARVDRGGG